MGHKFKREWFRFLDARWESLSEEFKKEILQVISNGDEQEQEEEYKDIKTYRHLAWFKEKQWLPDEIVLEKYKELKKTYPDFESNTGEKAEFDSYLKVSRGSPIEKLILTIYLKKEILRKFY